MHQLCKTNMGHKGGGFEAIVDKNILFSRQGSI